MILDLIGLKVLHIPKRYAVFLLSNKISRINVLIPGYYEGGNAIFIYGFLTV